MSRINSQAKIIFEEQLVPRANRLVIKNNNQCVASDSHINDIMLRFVVEILRHQKLYKLVSLTATMPIIYLHQFWTTINHNKNNHTFTFELNTHTFTLTPELLRTVLQMPTPNPNNTYTKRPSEIQILEFIKTLGYDEDPKTKMIAILKMVATRLHQPWRAILSVLNRSLTRKDSSWDKVRLPILQILWGSIHSANFNFASLIWDECDYKFGIEIPDTMISDAVKKLAGYKFYMAKKVESKNAKIVDEPEEQHVSLDESGKAKGFMCYGNQVENVPKSLKKDVVPRKTRSQTFIEETIIVTDTYAEWGQKLKGLLVDDLAVQSLLDLRKGSKASRLESLKQKKQAVAGEGSNKTEENANETNDADKSDMNLSDDNLNRDGDAAEYGTLLDETPANELTDFMSHLVYTDSQTTSVVHKPKENPKLTSYKLDASELSLDIDKNENHILGLSTIAIAKKIKAIIQKDWLPIADLEEKYTTSITKHYATRYYKTCIEDMISNKWSKETHRYIFEALDGIHHWGGDIIDFFKAEISTKTKGSVYSDLRIKSVVRVVAKKKWGYGFLTSIVVRRSDDKE
nr:hypothetical protein [Tanacetum cinerariifolium]